MYHLFEGYFQFFLDRLDEVIDNIIINNEVGIVGVYIFKPGSLIFCKRVQMGQLFAHGLFNNVLNHYCRADNIAYMEYLLMHW